MECCNAFYFANKMNQEPNWSQNYSEYFSRPEVLEEMRVNLAGLIQQESCEFDSIILGLRNVALASQHEQSSQLTDTVQRRVEAMIQSAQEQQRHRSNNLTSIATLAIRMIDYINQQQTSYYHSIKHYQIQVDRLQNTIDQLNNRNTMIESDVEDFREQLEAARNEIQEITEGNEMGEIQHSNSIECKIQGLENELQRMRAQIIFYKSSVFASNAFKSNEQDNNSNEMIHTKSLLALNQQSSKRYGNKDEENVSVSEQVEKNRELELENERLRNEIEGYRKSMLFFNKSNKNETTDLLHANIEGESPKNRQLLRVRTSSKKIIENSSCGSSFGFSEFFNLFKAKREERVEKLMKEQEQQQRSQVKLFHQPSQQSLQIYAKDEVINEFVQKPRHLSSEWSRDSLNIFNQQTDEIPQLIFLTQQSEQDQNEKADFETKPTSISQNKSSESSSSKADYYAPNTNKITLNKSYESVGINTSHNNPPTPIQGFFQTITSKSLILNLKDYIISNRLQRSLKSANSGTSTILI